MKKRSKYGIKHPSIPDMVDGVLGRETEDATLDAICGAIYRYSLSLSDGRAFSNALRLWVRKALKGVDDTEVTAQIRVLRDNITYSWYVMSDMWRAIVLASSGTAIPDILRVYKTHPGDIKRCLDLLTPSELATIQTRSIYRISKEDYAWVLTESQKIAKRLAYLKLRFLSKYDSGFDPEAELMVEAVRIANYYSSYPSRERIMGSIAVSLPREAERIREYCLAEQRKPIRKVPELRCPHCLREWEHRKNKGVLTIPDVLKKFPLSPEGLSLDDLFCGYCACSDRVVKLTHLDTDRDYTPTTVSIHQTSEDGGCSIEDVLAEEDDGGRHGEDQVYDHEYVEILSKKLGETEQTFLHILLSGDDQFDKWMRKKGVTAPRDEGVLGVLICEYMGVDWDSMRENIGTVLSKPKAYIVEVEGDKDLVFARSPSYAVHFLARYYKFPKGSAMAKACGKIRVREYTEGIGDFDSLSIEEGTVVPMLQTG